MEFRATAESAKTNQKHEPFMPNLSYISPKARVKESSIQGRGLFAVDRISKGEIVCVKGGHIFDGQTLQRCVENARSRGNSNQ